MRNKKKYLLMSIGIFSLFLFFSCTTDSEFLKDSILETPEEIVEETPPPTTDSGSETPAPENTSTNKIEGSYYPESAAELTDPSKANFKAIITKVFECNGCSLAINQTIEPAGGIISGTNINLNGAYIENSDKQAFSPEVTFTAIYEKSKLSPDVFGGFANDNIDDADAIDALINNAAFGTAKANGKYIKNAPSEYKRAGTFDWDLNGSKVMTTNNSKFRINEFDVDYIFTMTNLSPRIYNGEFDGTNTYGRLFWVKGQETFYFADLNVHDYHSTSNARAIVFRADLFPQSNNFKLGEIYRCTIDNIKSDSNGIANDLYGLSKGIWIDLHQTGNAEVFLEDNIITNILGDDAECLYIAPSGSSVSMTNNVHFYLTRETYKFAKRRQAKITVSNVQIKDSYFESPLVSQDFNGQATTILGVFSTNSFGETNKNFKMTNCDLVSSGVHIMHGLSLTEIEDATIENNRFTYSTVSNYSGISLGTTVSGYFGIFENNSIKNNTFTNCGVEISTIWNPRNGPVIIENSTFNYTFNGENPGSYIAALKVLSTKGVYSDFNFMNSVVNVKGSKNSQLFSGILYSKGASLRNFLLENIEINYDNISVPNPTALIGTPNQYLADFDDTNIIRNCKLNGLTGTSSIYVLGSNKSVKIIDSFDNLGNKITVK